MSSSQMLPGSFPCLAFYRVDDRSTVLFSASEKKPIAGGGDIGELDNMSICPTTHGFVLARDPNSLATFLWSPHNRCKIELPPLGVQENLLSGCTCLLSDRPAAAPNPKCVVLLVEPDATFIWYCHVGDDNHWEKYDYDIGTQVLADLQSYEKVPICPVAACRGKFYFNSTPTSLGVIDFCPAPLFSSIAIDDAIDGTYGYKDGTAKIVLVESDEELYMVRLLFLVLFDTVCGASVHRMDFSKKRWRRVDDLGDRTFLLSMSHLVASCSGGNGKCGLRQNCVYTVYPCQKASQIFIVKDGSAEWQKLEVPDSDKAFWMLPIDP